MSNPEQQYVPEPNRVDQVTAFILHGIRNGRFAPGQRLSEAEISEALGLKRGPVREGLRILAGEGVIDLRHNKGARIRQLDRHELADMIGVLATLNGASVRLVVERNDLRAIAAAINPLFDAVRTAIQQNNHPAFMAALENYHNAIYVLSANKYMQYLWSRLHFEHFSRSFILEFEMDDWRAVQPMFEAAHDSLLQGDWEAAARSASQRADNVARILAAEPRSHGRQA